MLQIGKYFVSEEVNGPGRRFVIWFQGCSLRCKGCFNPEFWDEKAGKGMQPKELMSCIQQAKEIEGVTFTGGEPLIQAKALLSLAKLIKAENLSIVCYTGYTLKEILDNKLPYAKELLKYIDILIDGRYYNEKEKASLLWRGSRNQKVHFLTERYKHLRPVVSKEESKIEIKVGRDNLIMTGIFDLEIWQKLSDKLKGEKVGY